jgi:hypothetical protein
MDARFVTGRHDRGMSSKCPERSKCDLHERVIAKYFRKSRISGMGGRNHVGDRPGDAAQRRRDMGAPTGSCASRS